MQSWYPVKVILFLNLTKIASWPKISEMEGGSNHWNTTVLYRWVLKQCLREGSPPCLGLWWQGPPLLLAKNPAGSNLLIVNRKISLKIIFRLKYFYNRSLQYMWDDIEKPYTVTKRMHLKGEPHQILHFFTEQLVKSGIFMPTLMVFTWQVLPSLP